MITEAQKQLVFDINCFYQLDSQRDKVEAGQPIATLPELGFVALMEQHKGEVVNWKQQASNIRNRLKSYGLSDNWIEQLQSKFRSYLQSGNTVGDFRVKFMTAIDTLIDMILGVASVATPSPDLASSIITEILEKDYWNGTAAQQVQTARTLSTTLNFDKKFIIEFGNALLKAK